MAIIILFEFSCRFGEMEFCLEIVDFRLCVVKIILRIPELSFQILNNSVIVSFITERNGYFNEDMRLLCSLVN